MYIIQNLYKYRKSQYKIIKIKRKRKDIGGEDDA